MSGEQAQKLQKVLQILVAAIPLLGIAFIPPAALAISAGISPVIGYIASFVQFSWDELKKLDKGNGIILTATWILPIATIPRTYKVSPGDEAKAI